MASSSASCSCSCSKQYDVFLSFRGEDTRDGFTSHLYAALYRKHVKTFKDDRDVGKGDEISPALLRSIEESRISVVIFSKDYASSRWCLEELNHILHCRKSHGQILIPIFYSVDPSHVRKQEESYAASFRELERRFPHKKKEIQEWRHALETAGYFSGWDSNVTRPESELVEKIVADIGIKLNRYWSSDELKLVGIDKSIEKIEELLLLDTKKSLQKVRIIGIWGMSGIGKTTLAYAVYKRISYRFSRCCLLEDVREKYEKDGPDHLRNTLLESLEKGKINIPCKLKVLIVLDDVNSEDQYFELIERNSRVDLDGHCRIIVTTNDSRVLKSIGASDEDIFEVKKLSNEDALQLFHLFANPKEIFGTQSYETLSRNVVEYAKGNPWALKVFASYLCARNEKEWEIASLINLENIPVQERIFKVLRKGYDDLDESLKRMYLDIACFFHGEDRDFVERILDMAHLSINDLIAKSLITIKHSNKLYVQALLQRMVQQLVCQQSKLCGDRHLMSRLWKVDDVCYIFRTKNTAGTENIEGIFLDMSEVNGEIRLRPDVFDNMRNLSLLKIFDSSAVQVCKVLLPQEGLDSLPHESLTYLHWHGYPLKSFPSNFTPKNLIELNLPYSQVEKLWEQVKLDKLKKIDLSYSKGLADFPNLSHAPNLEGINLEYCTSLHEVPSYVQDLDKLKSLNLKGCSSLVNLFVSENSEITRSSRHLTYITLDGTAIKELPSSIGDLIGLQILSLNMCKNLEQLPGNIWHLTSLQSLGLFGCSKLKRLPELPPSLPLVDARYCTSLTQISRSRDRIRDWSDLNHSGQKFVFCSCLNLDENARKNIMFDANVRLLHTAILTSQYGHDDANANEICFPGNEIPKWPFTNQSEGYSTNIEFLPNWCDANFLGVAFCVVVDFNECQLDGNFELSCQSTCIFSKMKSVDWRRTWTWHWNHSDHDTGTENIIKRTHTFLFYDYTCHEYFNSSLIDCEATNWPASTSQQMVHSATFEFYPKDSGGNLDPCSCIVLRCAIRPLYATDAQRFGFINQDHVGEEDCQAISSNFEQNVLVVARSATSNIEAPEPSGTGAIFHSNMIEQEGETNHPYCFLLYSQIKEIFDCICSKRSDDVEAYERKDQDHHRVTSSSNDQLTMIQRRFQAVDEVLHKYHLDITMLKHTDEMILKYLQDIDAKITTSIGPLGLFCDRD